MTPPRPQRPGSSSTRPAWRRSASFPARLTAGLPEDPAEARELLADVRTALVELLADRDDLARAHGEASEALAGWLGHI